MWNRFVFCRQYLFFELIDIGGIIWVLLRAHFVQDDTERPNVGSFRLMFVLPEFWCEIVWRANFLDFVILVAILECLFTDAPQWRRAIAYIISTAQTRTDLLDVAEITKLR